MNSDVRMTTEQMELCIRLAAAVAWADGILGIEERKALVTITEDLNYPDIGRAQQLFRNTRDLTELEAFAALDDAHKRSILRYVFLIAISEDGVSRNEEEILKKLAAMALPKKKWETVRSWLASWAEYVRNYHELFGTMPPD